MNGLAKFWLISLLSAWQSLVSLSDLAAAVTPFLSEFTAASAGVRNVDGNTGGYNILKGVISALFSAAAGQLRRENLITIYTSSRLSRRREEY